MNAAGSKAGWESTVGSELSIDTAVLYDIIK